MKKILEIAKKHNLLVIEDAAQAIGATKPTKMLPEDADGVWDAPEHWKKAGSFGNLGCFSLYWAKIFGTFGNLGVVTTNDDELAYKVSNLRANYRFEKDPDKVEYGYNDEPDNVWAGILNVRKQHLFDYLKRREEIAKMYLEGLRELEDRALIKLPWNQPGRVWQDFVLRINSPKDKEELLAHLDKHEVGYLGADPKVLYYPDYPRLNLPQLPHTKKYIEQQVRIPCHPFLTDEEVNYVVASIKSFWQ